MAQLEKMFNELAALGICKSGQRLWQMSSRDLNAFISFWKKWPEYLIEHEHKALAVIRQYLNNDDFEILSAHGIYVDAPNIDISIYNDTIVLVGNTTGRIRVKSYGVVKIYAYHDINITVEAYDNASVNIETYNSARIVVESESSRCKGYQYDNSSIAGAVDVECKEYVRGGVFNGRETY